MIIEVAFLTEYIIILVIHRWQWSKVEEQSPDWELQLVSTMWQKLRFSSSAPRTSRSRRSFSPVSGYLGSPQTSSSYQSFAVEGHLKGDTKFIAFGSYHLTSSDVFSWSNGLLFHQAIVDLTRSAILIPLGMWSLSPQSDKHQFLQLFRTSIENDLLF